MDKELEWDISRGPCFITEYDKFRHHVLEHCDEPIFERRKIGAMLMNQEYFNGVGNILRSEALYRLKISPFLGAKDYFRSRRASNALLKTLKELAKEIIDIGLPERGYHYQCGNATQKDVVGDFSKWLQCYQQEGMCCEVDKTGRTMWYAPDEKRGGAI